MVSTRDSVFKDTHKLKVKVQKKTFHANGNQKKGRVAILISDKVDFKQNCKQQAKKFII